MPSLCAKILSAPTIRQTASSMEYKRLFTTESLAPSRIAIPNPITPIIIPGLLNFGHHSVDSNIQIINFKQNADNR